MEITLTPLAQEVSIDPLPKPRLQEKIIRPEGLLNSNYKAIANRNLNNITSTSIFGIRQAIKSRQYQFTPAIDTLLKLTLFAIVLAVVL